MTTTTVHVRWVDAPPPAAPRGGVVVRHHAIADVLRAEPGRWAMLPDVPVTCATVINNGANTAYRPGGSFEAMSRQGVLYARYVGPAATS